MPTAAPARTVRKASTPKPVIPVYDPDGVLIGTVPQGAIIPAVAARGARSATAKADAPTLGGPVPAPRAGVPVVPVQDDDEEPLAKLARLRKTALHGYDPAERTAAYNALNAATLQVLTRVHAGR